MFTLCDLSKVDSLVSVYAENDGEIAGAWQRVKQHVEANLHAHNKQSKTVTIACTCGKRSATVHLCEQCFEDAVTS